MKKFLVIDIGGTYLKSALINEKAQISNINRIPTATNLEAFQEQILSLVSSVTDSIDGVAFSVPGQIDIHTCTIYHGGALGFLHKLSLRALINQKFPHLEVIAENDGKSAALGELGYGNLKNTSNSAVITLGTGVGGGLILSGKIYRGSHFLAGELSSIYSFENNNEIKTYGSIGSAVQMIHLIGTTLKLKNPDDGQAVFKAINQGNPIATNLFKNYCRQIAQLILSIQAILDLTHYAIGGGISTQSVLIEEINQQYDALLDKIQYNGHKIVKDTLHRPIILAAKLNNNANLYGAVYPFIMRKKIDDKL